jgi:peptidoglycan/xylan/chitin deacetylase (PgdA/CDA1 family)
LYIIGNYSFEHKCMNKILLTFDVEEFDIVLDYGSKLSLSEQIELSKKGMLLISKMLEKLSISATLFTTGTFAIHNKTLIHDLSSKHEIASHGMYHGSFDAQKDLPDSKKILEEITGKQVVGFRMPLMGKVDEIDLHEAGYLYNSSLNPTYIPGRYNNLTKPLKPFYKNNILNIPVSVSPILRIPLFWLSFKNFPIFLYKYLSKKALYKNHFLNIYFHPWEFTDLSSFMLPKYMKRYSKDLLLERLEKYLCWLKGKGEFITLKEYSESIFNQHVPSINNN